MSAMNATNQLGMDEEHIDNPDLEQALEERELARSAKADATGTFKDAHEQVKTILALLELPEEGAVRVGRFRIAMRHIKGGMRSFETSDRMQLSIGLVDAGDDSDREE